MNELLDSKPASGEGAEVAHNFSYGAFGEGEGADELKFTGRWGAISDTTSGILNHNRWSSRIHGAWISRDPGGLTGGLNLYSYVLNIPTLLVDPSGLSVVWFDRQSGMMYVYDKNGNLVKFCMAANNAVNPDSNPYSPEGHGPAPDGYLPTQNHHFFAKYDKTYGTAFWELRLPIQTPYGERRGVGLHGGRGTYIDPKGRGAGSDYPTHGCVRGTDACIDAARKLEEGGDPLEGVYNKNHPPPDHVYPNYSGGW